MIADRRAFHISVVNNRKALKSVWYNQSIKIYYTRKYLWKSGTAVGLDAALGIQVQHSMAWGNSNIWRSAVWSFSLNVPPPLGKVHSLACISFPQPFFPPLPVLLYVLPSSNPCATTYMYIPLKPERDWQNKRQKAWWLPCSLHSVAKTAASIRIIVMINFSFHLSSVTLTITFQCTTVKYQCTSKMMTTKSYLLLVDKNAKIKIKFHARAICKAWNWICRDVQSPVP